MNTELNQLETPQLIQLLSDISALLKERMSGDAHASSKPPAASNPEEPAYADQDFCMYIKASLENGSLITASERDRAISIIQKYPSWAARQGLPLSTNKGDWRRTARYMKAPRATRY